MRNRTLRFLGALSFSLASCRSAKVQVSNAERELTLATTAREKGDFPAALEHAQTAVVLAPGMTQAHFTVAEIADSMCLPNAQPGPDDRICGLADHEYRQTLERDGSHRQALKNLAYLLYEFNRLDESESYYRKALALQPDDPELMGGVAALDYFRIAPDIITVKAQQKIPLIQSPACIEVRERNQARLEEGIALLTRAVQITSNHSELKSYLGVLYSLGAEVQCGDRAKYQADIKSSRAWYMPRKDSGSKSRQEYFQKVPSPPPPPPYIQ